MTARDILSAQMEHLQSKYTGTGNAQTTKWYVPPQWKPAFDSDRLTAGACRDWMTQQHRDTLHSFVSHPNLLLFSSIVQNEPIEHVRSAALEVRRTGSLLPRPLSAHWDL